MTQNCNDLLGKPWRVRPARPDDAPSIVALLNDVFGNWGDLATWSWKYKDLPAPFPLISAVAEADGRLVGHYGIIPVTIIHQAELVRGAQAVDAAVLPEYRRQGILAALAKLVLDSATEAQVLFIYAFPGLYSLNLNRRIGFQPVMIVPEMVRLLGSKKFLIERLRSFPGDLRAFWRWRYQKEWSPNVIARLTQFRSSLIWMLSWLSAPVWHQDRPPQGVSVRKLAGFDASFDRFGPLGQVDKMLSLVKSRPYLSWRYCQHPQRAYLIWGAFEAEELVGYLVMHVADFKSSICELEYLPGNEKALFALVEAAAQAAQAAGSQALGIWVSNHSPLCSGLQKAGFISQRRLHQLAAKRQRFSAKFYQIILYAGHLPVQSHNQFFEVVNDWSLSMGDSDLV